MRKAILFIAMYAIWLFLVWPFNPVNMQDITAGLLVAMLVTVFWGAWSKDESWDSTGKLLEPKRYYWAVCYIPVLAYHMVLANLDVLYRVIHPDMPINPGIVKIRTELTSPLAKTVLCNSITLTPGTLSVDISGDIIYVHWINVQEGDLSDITEQIAGRFEKILKKVFE
ncbi:MAG: Na+/H+ antiporter subunit E [Elusimicrobiota bacterium]